MNKTFTSQDLCRQVAQETRISLAECKHGCGKFKPTKGAAGCNVVNYSPGGEYSLCSMKLCVTPIHEPSGDPENFGMFRSDARGYYMIGITDFILSCTIIDSITSVYLKCG